MTGRKFVAATLSLTISLSAMVWFGAPASAADSGSGRAIIRIDAAKATVERTGNQAYALTIPISSSGQWLGERTDTRGKTRLRVGNVSAVQLGKRWADFKYNSASVRATLTWKPKESGKEAVLVRVHRPVASKKGVTFRLTSDATLPSSMNGVALNLERSPSGTVRSTGGGTTVSLTSTLRFSMSWYSDLDTGGDDYYVTTTLDDSSNGNTCWTARPTYEIWKSLPNQTCAGVSVAKGETWWTYDPNNTSYDESVFQANLTPSGQSSMFYQALLLVWKKPVSEVPAETIDEPDPTTPIAPPPDSTCVPSDDPSVPPPPDGCP